MNRWAPYIIGGLMVLGFAERQIGLWLQSQGSLTVPVVTGPAAVAGACLQRHTVFAALIAGRETVRPETTPACAAGSGPADWYVVTGTGQRHLAFDAAGCLVTEGTAPCL